jgi:hypothetical protein
MTDPPLNPEDIAALLETRPAPLRTTTPLVCLNFKVPLQVRLRLKIYAARHDKTMTEVLLELLEDRLTADDERGPPRLIAKQEIKK